ncbi:HIT domain-containing protein [Stappia sp.]|uniref:HIT domain-containing protein n=1 Tax=Stappia sp. TaxID=1870903 RepID=UPI003A995FD5
MAKTGFDLDPRLEEDSLSVCDLPLCAVRLMRDARFPWLLMMPRRDGLTEIVDLDAAERAVLMEEIALVSEALKAATGCDKLNVANLGNMVSQLHVHVIARKVGDAAWPGPVWGNGRAEPYSRGNAEALARLIAGGIETVIAGRGGA